MAAIIVFLPALFLRVKALDLPPLPPAPTFLTRWAPARIYPYLENDEKLYIALVAQLESGKGYTLQGHPILREGWVDHEMYDHKLFFHPPGGVAFFWLSHLFAGDAGFALAQVLSFSIFFWSMAVLGRVLLQPLNRWAAVSLALVSASAPIMAQAAGRFWLDVPLLAFSAAATALFLLGIKRERNWLVCAGAVLLGYSSLIKLTAFFVLPGALALAWAIAPRERLSMVARRALLFVVIAAAIQLPWEICQWRMVGSLMPVWSKPSEQLIKTNPYVRYLTVVRPSWVYLELLPQVLWTLVPSMALLLAQWRNRELRNRGLALVSWIAVVVGVHMALGAMGYSKILRYVILMTPAAGALFALVVGGAVETIYENKPIAGSRKATFALLVFAALGLALEVTQGLKTALADNPKTSLIRPLPGLRGVDY